MAKITVDFSKKTGLIKKVNGVGQPPRIGWSNTSLFHFLTEAGIPYSRLHDVGGCFGGCRYVDISNIFPDFEKDPDDPASYDFTFTDPLITGLINAGVEPYYRLGETIENESWRKAYRIHAPKDPHKWAKICAGIVRHYTRGWANGFNYKITYWEVWNEPECIDRHVLWEGTWDQYMELYGITSKLLKEEFPEIKVGGYGSCGFYLLTHPEHKGNKKQESFLELFDIFLAYVKKNNCPMDFFSWHDYDTPETICVFADHVDKKLKEYGFNNVEQHLNEWNYRAGEKGKVIHSAATARFILAMQHSKVDVGVFYDGGCNAGIYGGLFNPSTCQPLKTYWTFIAFNELYKRKEEVFSASDNDQVSVCAASGEEDGAILIVNYGEALKDIELDLGGKEIVSCRFLDELRDLTVDKFTNTLPENSVLLLYVK